MSGDELIIFVGEVTAPHGIGGQVRVRSYTAPAHALFSYPLCLEDHSPAPKISSSREHKPGIFLCRFKDISTRSGAEALRGLRLYVPRENLPAPEEDAIYVCDLIGATLIDSDQKVVGHIEQVRNYGAGDFFEIIDVDGLRGYTLPYQKDAVFSVDLDTKKVCINPAFLMAPSEKKEKKDSNKSPTKSLTTKEG